MPIPEGTRGYDDLRRAANREPLGQGLRPSVASPGDLARMLAALGRDEDAEKLHQLRRLIELERARTRGREIERSTSRPLDLRVQQTRIVIESETQMHSSSATPFPASRPLRRRSSTPAIRNRAHVACTCSHRRHPELRPNHRMMPCARSMPLTACSCLPITLEWTKSTYSTKTTSGAIVMRTMATKELLNVRDTARMLGVHENTVRNWEARGLLRAVHLPGQRLPAVRFAGCRAAARRDVRAARAGH